MTRGGTWRSAVRVGVFSGAVPGHAGGGARLARRHAGRRHSRALHRLLRLHAPRPRAQSLLQGCGRARQRAPHDAARMDFMLLFGMTAATTLAHIYRTWIYGHITKGILMHHFYLRDHPKSEKIRLLLGKVG